MTQHSPPPLDPPTYEPTPLVQAALRAAQDASERVKERATTARQGFLRPIISGTAPSEGGTIIEAPLGRLQHSRASALHLKLYLALLWQAGGGNEGRHTTDPPARALAVLLGLPDPFGKGQRRVREALTKFEQENLIHLGRRPGEPPIITLQHEDGSGDPYTKPYTHWSKAKKQSTPVRENPHLFVQLPAAFWTNGWHLNLSGPALATLLILLFVSRNGTTDGSWLSMSEKATYGLSDDTWTRGVRELRNHGIVLVTRGSVHGRTDFDRRRVRNRYTVNVGRLSEAP